MQNYAVFFYFYLSIGNYAFYLTSFMSSTKKKALKSGLLNLSIILMNEPPIRFLALVQTKLFLVA